MKLTEITFERQTYDCASFVEFKFIGDTSEALRLRDYIRANFEIKVSPEHRPTLLTEDAQRAIYSLLNVKKKPAMKVIYNPPATILFVGDKKYVSKAHNEAFDEEKGLLMCLAKANGITHLELKRMIKGAERQGNENEKRT